MFIFEEREMGMSFANKDLGGASSKSMVFCEILPEKQIIHVNHFLKTESIVFWMGTHESQQKHQKIMTEAMAYTKAVCPKHFKATNTEIFWIGWCKLQINGFLWNLTRETNYTCQSLS